MNYDQLAVGSAQKFDFEGAQLIVCSAQANTSAEFEHRFLLAIALTGFRLTKRPPVLNAQTEWARGAVGLTF